MFNKLTKSVYVFMSDAFYKKNNELIGYGSLTLGVILNLGVSLLKFHILRIISKKPGGGNCT